MDEEAGVVHFTLYSTSACHLCELAADMLLSQQTRDHSLVFIKVDISDSDELFERYGVRIPVVAHPDGRELGWPFSPRELSEFTAS